MLQFTATLVLKYTPIILSFLRGVQELSPKHVRNSILKHFREDLIQPVVEEVTSRLKIIPPACFSLDSLGFWALFSQVLVSLEFCFSRALCDSCLTPLSVHIANLSSKGTRFLWCSACHTSTLSTEACVDMFMFPCGVSKRFRRTNPSFPPTCCYHPAVCVCRSRSFFRSSSRI